MALKNIYGTKVITEHQQGITLKTIVMQHILDRDWYSGQVSDDVDYSVKSTTSLIVINISKL